MVQLLFNKLYNDNINSVKKLLHINEVAIDVYCFVVYGNKLQKIYFSTNRRKLLSYGCAFFCVAVFFFCLLANWLTCNNTSCPTQKSFEVVLLKVTLDKKCMNRYVLKQASKECELLTRQIEIIGLFQMPLFCFVVCFC